MFTKLLAFFKISNVFLKGVDFFTKIFSGTGTLGENLKKIFNFGNGGNERRGHRRQSNFIFTFGEIGSGKSTLIATLGKIIDDNPNVNIRLNTSNPQTVKFLLQEWINKLRSKSFPPRSVVEEITEVDLAIERKDGTLLPLTFIEISGERFESINPASAIESRYSGIIDPETSFYMGRADIHLIVIDCTNCKKSNDHVALYLEHLDYMFKSMEYVVPVGIVLSKWDKVSPKDISVKEFMRLNLPRLYDITNNSGSRQASISQVFPFSVGSTTTQGNIESTESITRKNSKRKELAKIDEFDPSDGKKIMTWIWKELRQTTRE